LREVDGRDHTVIMVQVENEIGMIPDSRDRSAVAETLFKQSCRRIDELSRKRRSFDPGISRVVGRRRVQKSRQLGGGFGVGPKADEIFMAGTLRVTQTGWPNWVRPNIVCRCS
jgi:hypothetical protein